MYSTSNYPVTYGELSLGDMLRWHTANLNSELDPLGAARDNEQIHVGASFVSIHLNNRSWNCIRLSEVVRLNAYIVADCVEPGLDYEGKAGIARTVANLVACAHAYAADSQATLFSLSRTTCGGSAGRRSAPSRHLAYRTGVLSVTTPARRLRRKTRAVVAV
jgi:hypothetical protein